MGNPKINQIICFDVETGGLDRKTQKHALLVPITQYAHHIFRADTFEEICEFETNVQQYDDLELQPQALSFTGVTMKMINGGIDPKELVKKLISEYSKALTGHKTYHKPIFLGHNIGYDIQFIQYLFKRVGKCLSDYIHGSYDGHGNFQPAYLDTMWMSRALWVGDNDSKKFTLADCCERANVNLIEAHSALPDVRATKNLYQHIVKRMRNGGGGAIQVVEEEIKSRASFRI